MTIEDLNDTDDLFNHPLSRIHSVTYPDGHVWHIRFGSTILELTPTQALQLQTICTGIDDMFITHEGNSS